MIDEHEVREMLLRRAGKVPATPAGTARAVRRARRRLVLNGALATVVAVAIAGASFAGVDVIRSAHVPAARSTPTDAEITTPIDAETRALLEDFLQARVEGEGAERYVEVSGVYAATGGVPLLYATAAGTPYERSEYERVDGPADDQPFGDAEFKVRLFAEGGRTVVEQLFYVNSGTGRLEYWPNGRSDIAPTTENGQPVAVPYRFLDGQVTLQAAYPWAESGAEDGLFLDDDREERLVVVGDPLPVETGCEPGPAALNAEALASSIRSDPDLEATAPVSVSVGGTEALRMDVTAASGASVCERYPAPQVLMEDGASWGIPLTQGDRMRLYLLDLPGGSGRILAIAIVAPEAQFERVMEAAAPPVDTVEFHTPLTATAST